VVCKKDSLGEHDISGLCSSITFIASRVSQKVLPTRESSYTKTASTLEDLTNSTTSWKPFLEVAGILPLTAGSSKKNKTW
jgi:hypothetical protein